MARRRNKKQTQPKSGESRNAASAPEIAAPRARKNPGSDTDAALPANKSPQARHASIATCVGGMILTFILGLYLGSLLPGVMNDFFRTSGEAPAREARAVQTLPSQPEENSSLASELPKQPQEAETGKAPAMPGIPTEMAARISELERIVGSDGKNAAAYIELGNLNFDTNRPRRAIEAYEKALEIAPNNANVLTDLGIMYRETGEFNKALECFQKALAINPVHQNAMYNEGVVLFFDLGRKNEAEAAWKKLLEANPDATAPDGKPVSEMINHLH